MLLLQSMQLVFHCQKTEWTQMYEVSKGSGDKGYWKMVYLRRKWTPFPTKSQFSATKFQKYAKDFELKT